MIGLSESRCCVNNQLVLQLVSVSASTVVFMWNNYDVLEQCRSGTIKATLETGVDHISNSRTFGVYKGKYFQILLLTISNFCETYLHRTLIGNKVSKSYCYIANLVCIYLPLSWKICTTDRMSDHTVCLFSLLAINTDPSLQERRSSLIFNICCPQKFFRATKSHLTRDVIYDGTRNIIEKINETYL